MVQAISSSRVAGAPSMLEATNLSVKRSGKLVLEEVNLQINKGEFVGIVGPNGGGKSTFLLTVLGLSLIHI